MQNTAYQHENPQHRGKNTHKYTCTRSNTRTKPLFKCTPREVVVQSIFISSISCEGVLWDDLKSRQSVTSSYCQQYEASSGHLYHVAFACLGVAARQTNAIGIFSLVSFGTFLFFVFIILGGLFNAVFKRLFWG